VIPLRRRLRFLTDRRRRFIFAPGSKVERNNRRGQLDVRAVGSRLPPKTKIHHFAGVTARKLIHIELVNGPSLFDLKGRRCQPRSINRWANLQAVEEPAVRTSVLLKGVRRSKDVTRRRMETQGGTQ
jgi:hypothetical protein